MKTDVRELELSDARTGVILAQLDTLWKKFDELVKEVAALTTETTVNEVKIYAIAVAASAVLSAAVSVAIAVLT